MSDNTNVYKVRVIPIISEKSLEDAKKGKFTVAVAPRARQVAIIQAIEKVFNVHVVGITTSTVKGKKKRTGTKRIEREEQVFKKAIAKLVSGQTISAFGVGGK